nr:hypothetical protein [Bacteroidota bacterium]
MKKLILFILVTFCLAVLKGQNWTEFTASESTVPSYNIIQSNDTIVKFNVFVPGMIETAIDTFNRVSIKEHSRLDSVGYPEIPMVSFLVAIPQCDSVNLLIELLDSIQISGYNIYPAPELVADTLESGAIALIEQFAYDTSAYETDAMFPGIVGETVDKGAIRAQHVVRVILYPLQFNPVKDIINVYSNIEISLTFYNASGNIQQDVGIFNEVVGNTLINYNSNGLNASVNCGAGLENAGNWYFVDSLPNERIDDPCDYIIITHDSLYFKDAGQAAIDSLAAHRANFNGFDVAIVTTFVIDEYVSSGFPLKIKIRDFIKNTYDYNNANHTYDGKLAYINLFGDAFFGSNPLDVCIPTHSEGYDVYFTRVYPDEDDVYPDLMIGRCSVDDTEEVQNVVHKILHYKPDTLSWRNNMLNLVGTGTNEGVLSNAMLELDDIIEDQYNVKLSIPDNFEEPVPDWNTIPYILDSIQAAYQQGVMFFNHFSHGDVTYWQSPLNNYTKIPATPDYNLPFVISVACHTGAFQATNDCLGEKFLCADSAMGAIGFIGATEETAWGTARIPPLFQKALLKNYSVISGEAFLEVKLADATLLWNNDYNLLGDPALNVLHESTDTIFPELVIKDFEIGFNPLYPNAGDTLLIKPVIRNMTRVSATNGFYVSCKATNKFNQDTIWIGNVQIDSLSGYTKDTANFQWNTKIEDYGVFNFVFEIDTCNNNPEMNELNNLTSIQKPIYLYDTKISFTSATNYNSGPVSFDKDTSYAGEEICFGRNILSATGATISSNNEPSSGFTSVANLTNNQNYQFILRSTDSLFSIGTPSWAYPSPASYFLTLSPFVTDFDQNGNEEVVFTANQHALQDNGRKRILCLNSDGSLRWDHALHFSTNAFPIICNINQETQIVLSNNENKVYYALEDVSGLTISDSITISNCTYIYDNQFVADINQDGVVELVLQCKVPELFSTRDAVVVVNLETKDTLIKKFSLGKDYFLYGISDINNDGDIEIITREDGSGLYILEHDLDSLIFISDQNIISDFFVSGDFNNDGKNDIAVVISIDDQNYIRIYGATGTVLYTIPSISDIESFWVSDIDKDDEIDLICSSNHELFMIDVPNTGKTIGWPGQRGNVRNTGTLLQPAYYKSNDTVYWTDNISIPDTFEIPSGATVIVKPDTRIYATEDAEFIVYGKLIAHGSEYHPIKFTGNIMGAGRSYWGGITAKTNGTVDLEYCHIENAEVGLFLYSTASTTIRYNTFKNNRIGLCAYANSPVIRDNYFTDNAKAVAAHAGSTPYLASPFSTTIHYNNGIINNDSAISIYSSTPYVVSGYNDIYNDTLGIYMAFYSEPPSRGLRVGNNYYGSTVSSEVLTHFVPSNKFEVVPLLDSAQTSFKNQGADGAADLLAMAFEQFNQQKYTSAVQIFNQLIDTYPEETEALWALTGSYQCHREGNLPWISYIDEMESLVLDSTLSAQLQKYARDYMLLAMRHNLNYNDAIAGYEAI